MAALKLTTFYDNVWIFNIADVVSRGRASPTAIVN